MPSSSRRPSAVGPKPRAMIAGPPGSDVKTTQGISMSLTGNRSTNTKTLTFARGKLDLSSHPESPQDGRCRTILLHLAASDVPEFESRTRSLFAAVFCTDLSRAASRSEAVLSEPADDATVVAAESGERVHEDGEAAEDVLVDCENSAWMRGKENSGLSRFPPMEQPHPLAQTSAITIESTASAPCASAPDAPATPALLRSAQPGEERRPGGASPSRPARGRPSGRLGNLRKMFSTPPNRPARPPRPPRHRSRRSLQSGPNDGDIITPPSPEPPLLRHARTNSRGRSFAWPRRASASSDTLKNLLSIGSGEDAPRPTLQRQPETLPVQQPQPEHVEKLAWRHLGTTEVARKLGRDVEFSATFALTFNVDHGRPILRVVLFDAGHGPGHHHLLAFSDVNVRKVFANAGVPVASRMYIPPASLVSGATTLDDVSALPKNRGRYNGEILVACDMIGKKIDRFRLDVECNQILRAKALTTANVKSAFYTIHGILEKGSETPKKGVLKDHWILLYRSDTCQMVHGKRHGGTRNYNHFSSSRMQAGPGVIQNGQKIEGKKKERSEVTKPPTGALDHLWKKLGTTDPELFFSLPGADLFLTRKNRRLKLSMFEDHGSGKGYELIAETQFSMTQLQTMEIGQSIAIRLHTNVVGRAELKFVDCDASDRRYFCLSLVMQSL